MIYLPKPKTDFPDHNLVLAMLLIGSRRKIRITKKLEAELFELAKLWLPDYKPCYGDSFDTPWGVYMFLWVVWAVQASKFDLPEFIEGREYGRTSSDPKRESTYRDEYRRITWESGYLVGICERDVQP